MLGCNPVAAFSQEQGWHICRMHAHHTYQLLAMHYGLPFHGMGSLASALHRLGVLAIVRACSSQYFCSDSERTARKHIDTENAMQITLDKQKAIAEELDRTPGEVLKKLEDLRNKLL